MNGIEGTASIDPVPTSSVMGRNFLPEALNHPPCSPDKPGTTAFAPVSKTIEAAAIPGCGFSSKILD
jgi:hypothetical protein